MSDLIDRQDAIDALWKALHEYEDKTEKQFGFVVEDLRFCPNCGADMREGI